MFAAGRVLDGRRLPLPFARPGVRYALHAAYTGGHADDVADGDALAALGLPLPDLRGDLPGYLCHIKTEG